MLLRRKEPQTVQSNHKQLRFSLIKTAFANDFLPIFTSSNLCVRYETLKYVESVVVLHVVCICNVSNLPQRELCVSLSCSHSVFICCLMNHTES